MRISLFLLALILVACSSNSGNEFPDLNAAQHAPEITNLTLSPDAITQMEGGGNVVVTAEITFQDDGRDLQTLWVGMPDGTTLDFDESIDTETGTFIEDFAMSTQEFGIFPVEFWLVDKAGNTSNHRTVDIDVGWTNRLGGLPYALNDIIWDGTVFIAVGNGGTVLTSADGIDWVARDSGTDATLSAVATFETDIFAVGDEVVLLSTNHGENWITKAMPDSFVLGAVAVNSSQVVVGGRVPGTLQTSMMISEDRGDTWQTVDSTADNSYWFRDLIYRNGLFVATTEKIYIGPGGDARVQVSSDGKSWHEVVVLHEGLGLSAITHDGSQFVATGIFGAVFTSFDGFNWTGMRETPPDWLDRGVEYLSAGWDGSKLLVAGGMWPESCDGLIPCNPGSRIPIGIASTDGGASWESFNIDGRRYKSRGMAFGGGRFVSVGASPVSGEGAIYTAE
jgi:hypothetical protein